jgi:phosphotransferase system HPr-like phosphotransfer protein
MMWIFLLPMFAATHNHLPAQKPGKESQKPMIEFPDEMKIGKGDNEKAMATVTLTITLVGIEQKEEIKITFKGTSATANATIAALITQLRGDPKTPSQWEYTPKKLADIMDNKLIIEGWTDLKTMKFCPVKEIKFESPDIQKKYWPTIKMPPTA